MNIFSYMENDGYEQLIVCQDRPTGLKAIIAIHSTILGPALGGTRMWPYASENEAIEDACRLAKGMTYKSAAAGLDYGGGKAVIIGNPQTDKTESLFRALGRFVESLGGRFITAEDVGTSVDEMNLIRRETHFVCGLNAIPGSSGDPSPVTALGVWKGIRTSAKAVWGSESLAGRTIAVQGVGNVGYPLAKYLHEDGADLVITDIMANKAERVNRETGARVVAPDAIYDTPCDIFVPAALGAVINDDTLPRFRCRIIAGPANNQLADSRHGDRLHSQGILYAPDYIINAGGVINVADELKDGYNHERALRAVEIIPRNLAAIFSASQRDNIPTYKLADQLAENRIAVIGKIKSIFLPQR